MVPESQISQRQPHQGVDIFSVLPSCRPKLYLNNTEEKQQVCVWWYEVERIVLFVFCCSVFIMCVCISYVEGIADREVCHTSIHNISARWHAAFFINTYYKREMYSTARNNYLSSYSLFSLPEIILFSVTSNWHCCS